MGTWATTAAAGRRKREMRTRGRLTRALHSATWRLYVAATTVVAAYCLGAVVISAAATFVPKPPPPEPAAPAASPVTEERVDRNERGLESLSRDFAEYRVAQERRTTAMETRLEDLDSIKKMMWGALAGIVGLLVERAFQWKATSGAGGGAK